MRPIELEELKDTDFSKLLSHNQHELLAQAGSALQEAYETCFKNCKHDTCVCNSIRLLEKIIRVMLDR